MHWRSGRSQGFARLLRVSVGVLVGLGWLALAASATGAPAARAAGSASVSIVIPVPTGSATSGPVGANVTFTASGLTPSDKYSLGYATSTDGCVVGDTDMQLTPFSPNADGTYSMTFAWPSAAKNMSAPYVICLADATLLGTPPIQSSNTFQVLDTDAPKIELKHVPVSVGPGTPAPTPEPESSYLAGDVVQITGAHYAPGGLGGNTTLGVYLTTGPAKNFGDLSQGRALSLTSGSLTPDASGHFVARVTLPDASVITASGQYYLYVVSGDGSATALPSLVAFRQITVAPPPTPTPTATATSTPSAAASPSTTPGGNSGGSSSDLGLIIGLGALSVVLFIVGVILLASAAALPRGGGQY